MDEKKLGGECQICKNEKRIEEAGERVGPEKYEGLKRGRNLQFKKNGRADWTRTSDPFHPKEVR